MKGGVRGDSGGSERWWWEVEVRDGGGGERWWEVGVARVVVTAGSERWWWW